MELPVAGVGFTAVKANLLRAFTVIPKVSGEETPDTVAFTVPLVTTTPDHVRLPTFCVRVTVLPPLSLNCHAVTVTPEGVTVQVAVPPRVTDAVQPSAGTFTGPGGWPTFARLRLLRNSVGFVFTRNESGDRVRGRARRLTRLPGRS